MQLPSFCFTKSNFQFQTDIYLWRKVFFVSAGLYLFTNTVYVIFGTAETAEWDKSPEDETDNLKEMESMLKEKDDMEKIHGGTK